MLAILSVVFAVGCTVITSGSADASTRASRPLFGPGITLSGISCSSSADCTAVGQDAYRSVPIHATETSGAWGAATEVPTPDVLGGSQFLGVSCTSAKDCAAVGYSEAYHSPGYTLVSVHETESAGVWRALMGGDGLVVLLGVSCMSATDCTAVGGDGSAPVYESEKAGTWGSATEISPVRAGEFLGVSCTSATDCTAVGTDGNLPIYATETAGTWGATTEVSAPGGAQFNGVSCTSAADCTAVGTYNFKLPIYATETAGVWGAAREVAPPGGLGHFTAISCTSALDCTAVGYTESPTYTDREPFYATEAAGVWAAPKDVFSPIGGGSFSSVSCTSATSCTAVGFDGDGYAIYPTEKAGVWPKVPRAPRIGTLTPGYRSVEVAWTAPTSDGGASVTTYTASAVSAWRTFTCTTSRKNCTIHGLANGTTYAVSVLDRNAAGSSAPSATKTAKPRA